MGIRETLNDNPRITTGVTAAIIVIILAYLLWPSLGSLGSGGGGGQAYFTSDDGKSYFADDAKKVPPYQTKDGKEAVRAFVWQCGNGKPFVAYLMRYTPDARKKLEQITASNGKSTDPAVLEGVQFSGVEVKAPGADKWVKQTDPAAGAITTPKCPTGDAQPVNPA